MREQLSKILLTSALVVSMLGLGGYLPAPAQAAGATAAAGRYMMVTGFSRSGLETLYVIDDQQGRLAAYEMQQGGLALVSVRRIDQDFRVVVARDASKKGLRAQELIDRYKKADASTSSSSPSRSR